jgi:transposase InsO family protein
VLRRPVESVQFRSRRFVESLRHHGLTGSMGRVGAGADYAAMESLLAGAEERPGPSAVAHTPGPQAGDHCWVHSVTVCDGPLDDAVGVNPRLLSWAA